MLYTIIIYSVLTLGMLMFYSLSKGVLCNGVLISKRKNIPLIAILIFSIVFGIRYNVGIDHLAYLEKYLDYQMFQYELDREIGYTFLVKLFADAGAHFSVFFGFIAFLQLFLVCFALREHYKVVGWVIVIFMLSTTFLNFMNVIRQNLAFGFEFVALYYLAKRKYLLTYLNIIFAILIHVSAVILLPLPLFFIKKKNSYFNNIRLQIILFAGSLFTGIVIKPALLIFSSLSGIAAKFGYANYALMIEGGNMQFMEFRRDLGLGFILLLFINIINIINSNKVKSYWNSRLLNIIYDFYFVGVLYNYVVLGSLILGRLNIYFYSFNFIISSFTLYYLRKNYRTSNMIMFLLIILSYLGIWGAIVILRGAESHAIYKTFF